ncbi:MAG TPA: ThiF family adenylyltransferase [Nitrospiraceae bacterium]|nr:ThiF family adenylyltransferase [Nitrospiraceae bacterium]
MVSTRSQRQSFLGPDSEKVLSSGVVVIVGLCGGGSHIAQLLAHIGVDNYKIVDPDFVDDPNLNRMVGSTPNDAIEKRPKVEVIRDLILRIRPAANIEMFATKWQENHLPLRSCTAVFGCVDSFASRNELEAYCRRFLIPYIDIGMDVHELASGRYMISGQVIASIPGQPCMKCMGVLTEERISQEAQRYGDAGDRPQVIWPNGVLASTAVGMFVSLLTPWDKQSELVPFIEYDGNSPTLKPSSVIAILDKECKHYPIPKGLGDPMWNGIASDFLKQANALQREAD